MEHVQAVGNHLYDAAKCRYVATSVGQVGTLISLTVGLSLPAIGYTVALYMLNSHIFRAFPSYISNKTTNFQEIQSSNTNKKMTYFAVTGCALFFSASPILMILGSFQIRALLYRFCGSHLEVTDGEPNLNFCKRSLNFCKRSLSTIIIASPFIYACGLNPATFTAITIYKTVHDILPKKVLASWDASAPQAQAVIAHNIKISLLNNSIFLALGFIANPTLFALVALSLSDIATTLTYKLHDYATQDSQPKDI